MFSMIFYDICSAIPNICRTDFRLTQKIPAKFSTSSDFIEKFGSKAAEIPAKFSTYSDFYCDFLPGRLRHSVPNNNSAAYYAAVIVIEYSGLAG